MTGFGPILRRLVEDFDDLELRWALVGGLAVSARAEPRATRDVDVALAARDDAAAEHASPQDLDDVSAALRLIQDRGTYRQKDLLREFDRLSAQARNEH